MEGGSWTCVPCAPGYYSSTISTGSCTPCGANEYSPTEGATGSSVCQACPPELPFSVEGSASCSPPPDQCIGLVVEGCAGTDWETAINGEYKLFEGECEGATPGRDAYVNLLSGAYLFHSAEYSDWRAGNVCGSSPSNAYGGGDGLYPFVNTPSTWQCSDSNAWPDRPMSISCSLYSGQQAACIAGTYNSTGLGPEGQCHACLSHLESSFPGSTSADQCFTTKANVLTVSYDVSRITASNSDTNDHRLLTEGGIVNRPYDAAFISGTELVASMYSGHVVAVMNVEGETVGTFAKVGGPTGLLFLPEKRKVAVASFSVDVIYFFDLDDYKNKTLEKSDAVATVEMDSLGAVSPRYLSVGETDDEMLATTGDGKVVRICVPASPSCKPSLRNRVMVSGGAWFRGVGVLREKESYLVVDSTTDYIRQCPLSSVDIDIDIDINSCSVFAYQPEGVDWRPWGLLVDELKKLVYVTDKDKNIVHVFSYDGDYFGHLADQAMFLSLPTGLAIKPGPLAAISPITPPSSATAGEPIITNMDLRARDNKPLSPTYNIAGELSRYQVTATGRKDGFATTIRGSVLSASEAHILIKFAGVWNITIMEGINNPQNLYGSPYEITVNPAPTDPAACQLAFPPNLAVDTTLTATISTFDKFLNPTPETTDTFYYYLKDPAQKTLITDLTFSLVVSKVGPQLLYVVNQDDLPVASTPVTIAVTGDVICTGEGFAILNGDCLCSVGKVIFEDSCVPCPVGTLCRALNTPITTMPIDSGFWRSSNASIEILQCANEKSCTPADSSTLCAPHHTGPF